MKKILTAALALAMSTSVFCLDIFNYIPVTGNVSNYIQTNFVISSKFGNFFRTPDSKIVHKLDPNGKEIEVSELTARDALVTRTEFVYDEAGNVTEQTTYNSDNNVMWKTIYTYKDGLKADYSEYSREGALKARTIFTYENGKLVDETGYDGEGALIWKTVYKNNTVGLVESVCEYSADGSLDNETTYAYADSGKVESITRFDSFTGLSEQDVFRYGANGTLSEITTYDNNKQIIKRVLVKYDNSGNVARVSEYTIAQKFGTTVNELTDMLEVVYNTTLPATTPLATVSPGDAK